MSAAVVRDHQYRMRVPLARAYDQFILHEEYNYIRTNGPCVLDAYADTCVHECFE